MYKCQNQTEMAVKMANKLTYQYKGPEVLYKIPKNSRQKNLSKQQSLYTSVQQSMWVSNKITRIFNKKIFPYMAKTKKEKLNSFKF